MLEWPDLEVWADSLEDAGEETLGLRLGIWLYLLADHREWTTNENGCGGTFDGEGSWITAYLKDNCRGEGDAYHTNSTGWGDGWYGEHGYALGPF